MVDFTLNAGGYQQAYKVYKNPGCKTSSSARINLRAANLSSKPSVTRDTSRSNYNLHTVCNVSVISNGVFVGNWKLFLVNRITLLLENKSTRANNAGVRDIAINLIKLFTTFSFRLLWIYFCARSKTNKMLLLMFRHLISAPWPSQFLYSTWILLCLEEVINENLQVLAGFMLHIHLTRGESDCFSASSFTVKFNF